jgi:Thiamine pyrophosphate enzyme, C-terminal TPP binding domain
MTARGSNEHYRLPVTFVLFNNNAHAMSVISEQLFYGDRYSYNRFAPSRLGAGLAAMLPRLSSVDVTDADAFGAAMRTALDVKGPSVVSVECAAGEIPPLVTSLGPFITKKFFIKTSKRRTNPMSLSALDDIVAHNGTAGPLEGVIRSATTAAFSSCSTTRSNTACGRPSPTFQPTGGRFTAKRTPPRV